MLFQALESNPFFEDVKVRSCDGTEIKVDRIKDGYRHLLYDKLIMTKH